MIKPLVEALFAYLKQNESLIPQSGKIKEAFTYAFNQERYLKVFLEDGEVTMDNNIALSTLARQSIIFFLYKEGKFTKFES